MRSRITTQSVSSLVFSLIIIVLLALTFIQIQYLINERAISTLAGDNIRIISKVIQFAINEIDDISTDILSDSQIQKYNSSLTDPKDIQLQLQNVATLFGSYQIFKPYIETFYIGFENEESYSIGKVQNIFTETFFESRETKLRDEKGKLIVTIYPGDPERFIVSREIRRIKNLEQGHIASLYIVINFEKLFDIYFRKFGIQNIRLFLLQGNNIAYNYDKKLDSEWIENLGEKKSGVRQINGQYFYLQSANIENTDWKVFILLPFSNIAKLRNNLIYISFLGLLLGLIGLASWGRYWAQRITRPIILLADKMEELQKTDFSERNTILPKYERQDDEIAILYDNFDRLLKKIDILIHENYRKQLLLKETQLKNLIAQINPHFIYNTLDTVSWMAMEKGTEQISAIVQSLAMLLRASVEADNIIPLADEVELLKQYLSIQKIRFQERLNFDINITGNMDKLTVPSMILQPIVENSIKYSLDIPKTILMVSIEIILVKDSIQITISDNGPGISSERLKNVLSDEYKESLGLGNIKNRLNIFYGEQSQLQIFSVIGEGTKVVINVPFEAKGVSDEEI
ncbi:MAG: histidine kinase [Spirochaetales bacterium]|nr:histidine kinase [Spirochaetales bacterium]